MLIRQRKRKAVTTDSRHWMRKYPNQIKELEVVRPEQLWVSDITYIRLVNQWGYLSLITDAYSHQVMGHSFRTDLSAEGCIDALKRALQARAYPQLPLIHHSDRGSQYCCEAYVKLLYDHQVTISMTQSGNPYDNALAERLNGILKNEFNLYECRIPFEAAAQRIAGNIKAYNELRPHDSCNLLTPQQAHKKQGPLAKKWKNYKKKAREPESTALADVPPPASRQ